MSIPVKTLRAETPFGAEPGPQAVHLGGPLAEHNVNAKNRREAETRVKNSGFPGKMIVNLRRLNFESDRTELVATLQRLLSPQIDESKARWLYRDSPLGAARAWVACDSASGQIVGCAASFPRKFWIRGEEKLGLVLGDFCMDQRYRSLGPSLQLQRACLEDANLAPFEFCYDFPSQSMMAVYKRLGVNQCGTLVRWAKPLRSERKLETLMGANWITRQIASGANVALRMRGWKGRVAACAIGPLEGPCGSEFTALDEQLRNLPGVRGVGDADFLNWRFLAFPGEPHEILTARRSGKLIGFVVFSTDLNDTCILDLRSIEEPDVIARLLGQAVERLRLRGASSVNLNAGDNHPWQSIFHRAGFRPRETTPVVVHVHPGSKISVEIFRSGWYLMRGDRDS